MSSRGRSLTRSKRARSSSSSGAAMVSRSRSRVRTSGVTRKWPYASNGMGMLWDPFPAKARALLRYSQVITLTTSTGLTDLNIFRAASIFDPDWTGTGHQPYGHDTYQSIYNHYMVDSATLTMTPITTGSSQIFGISLTDDTTVQGDYNTVRETKGTRVGVAVGTGPRETLTKVYSRKQNFNSASDKPLSANFGASPAEDMYFHCWAEAPTSTTGATTVSYLITISYIVDMWELKDLGQS